MQIDAISPVTSDKDTDQVKGILDNNTQKSASSPGPDDTRVSALARSLSPENSASGQAGSPQPQQNDGNTQSAAPTQLQGDAKQTSITRNSDGSLDEKISVGSSNVDIHLAPGYTVTAGWISHAGNTKGNQGNSGGQGSPTTRIFKDGNGNSATVTLAPGDEITTPIQFGKVEGSNQSQGSGLAGGASPQSSGNNQTPQNAGSATPAPSGTSTNQLATSSIGSDSQPNL